MSSAETHSNSRPSSHSGSFLNVVQERDWHFHSSRSTSRPILEEGRVRRESKREQEREGLTRRTLSFLQQRASQRRHGQTARSVRGAKSKASREASTQTGSSVPSQRTRSPSAEGRERRRPSHAVLMFREGTEERNAVRTRNRGRRRGSRVHLMSEDLPVIWT